MNVTTAKTIFKSICENEFLLAGFKFSNKREAYKCKMSANVEYLAHCRVVNAGVVLIEPSFSIRYLPIETVFHNGMKTEKRFVDMTSVLWTGANTIMNEEKDVIFEVYTPEDAKTAAFRFVDIYLKYGKHFFDSSSTLQRIDTILNCEPSVFCPYQPSSLHRSCFGSIAAIMCHGRNNAEETIAAHRNALLKVNSGFYLTNFEDVLKQTITQVITN
jgi:hypothetical protein